MVVTVTWQTQSWTVKTAPCTTGFQSDWNLKVRSVEKHSNSQWGCSPWFWYLYCLVTERVYSVFRQTKLKFSIVKRCGIECYTFKYLSLFGLFSQNHGFLHLCILIGSFKVLCMRWVVCKNQIANPHIMDKVPVLIQPRRGSICVFTPLFLVYRE